MRVLLLLLVAAVSSGLCFGHTAEFEVRKLGDGIMSIPVLMPVGLYDVFDFSKDSRYIWTSETNCYDLTGCHVKTGTLDASSYPLPRMKWKKKFVGADLDHPFREIEERIKSDTKDWFDRENDGSEVDSRFCDSTLTFPPSSSPIVAAVFCFKGEACDFVSIARFTNDDEIVFGPAKKIEFTRTIGSLDFSPDMRHFVLMHEFSEVKQIKIMRVGVESDASEYTDNSIVDVISKSELKQLFGEKKLWIDARGHGFVNENYYVFTCNRGGRFSFTARDYFVVYGLREKRIVKVFKSCLRWLDEGCPIRYTDFALSADEKYLAIRYDGKITVYRFQGSQP